jgi:threonylcarbamoyladenosine tRNA methylthiotransferase MtaB
MKIHLETFGCRANHYDTETVRALAEQAGHTIVADARDADLAVFNSCAVTAEAERDVRKSIRRAARANPRLRSVVMGCASALKESRSALRALPTVESLIPGADLRALASILGVEPPSPDRAPLAAAAENRKQSTVRANLRVQDGCDEHCTFCATTIARGANRSRSIDELVHEAEALAEHHPEIVITGTHIGAYGGDNGSSLGRLMQTLVTRVPGPRFRLSSIEATEVDAALTELLRDSSGRVVPHLHAPLQSGSDRLLKRMGRHWYTAEAYVDAIERIVAGRGVFGLGADIIVGFPAESDEDFALTEAVVQQLPFTYLHVFSYSPRAGTAATRLPDPVPLSATHARSHRLRHLAQEKGAAYRRSRVGGTADIVVIRGAGEREGMTEDYLTVRLRGDRPRGDRFRARLVSDDNALTLEV